MSPNSVIISNAAPQNQGGFGKIVSRGQWGVFRQRQREPGYIDLTVILPSQCRSKSIDNLVQTIAVSEHIGEVLILDFKSLVQRGISTQAVVVLASLEGDIENSEIWAGVRHVLLQEDKIVVWVLQGASIERSNSEHAKIMGLLRTARNENQQSRFISLDVEKSSSVS